MFIFICMCICLKVSLWVFINTPQNTTKGDILRGRIIKRDFLEPLKAFSFFFWERIKNKGYHKQLLTGFPAVLSFGGTQYLVKDNDGLDMTKWSANQVGSRQLHLFFSILHSGRRGPFISLESRFPDVWKKDRGVIKQTPIPQWHCLITSAPTLKRASKTWQFPMEQWLKASLNMRVGL